MIYESKNGYIIERRNHKWFRLTRKNGIYSNYFCIDDESEQPSFDWDVYVNKYTIALCKRVANKIMEADKNEAVCSNN